jgi:hypothetical protein
MQAYLAGVKFLLQRLAVFVPAENSGTSCPISQTRQIRQHLSRQHACLPALDLAIMHIDVGLCQVPKFKFPPTLR